MADGMHSGKHHAAALGNRTREVTIAVSVGGFVLGQSVFLAAWNAIPATHAVEIWIVATILAVLSAQAWMVRRHLPAHADMLLLMLAWGGFGMLWGWQLDGAMQAAAHHAGRGFYQGIFRWLNWMNVLMLVFAFPPSLWWARCLVPYRPFRWRLVWVLALDAVGMVLGMMAGGRLLGHPLAMALEAPVLAHHLAMLLGMLVGMALTMVMRPWLAPLPSGRPS
jgi:hypothetical protein